MLYSILGSTLKEGQSVCLSKRLRTDKGRRALGTCALGNEDV